jgi:hypothetical protein
VSWKARLSPAALRWVGVGRTCGGQKGRTIGPVAGSGRSKPKGGSTASLRWVRGFRSSPLPGTGCGSSRLRWRLGGSPREGWQATTPCGVGRVSGGRTQGSRADAATVGLSATSPLGLLLRTPIWRRVVLR